MEKKLFGTDGIRGVAGEPPLDPKTVFVIGRSLGEYLRLRVSAPRVLVAEDTRESSPWIAETLAGGLSDSGVAVATPGVLTTPGLAFVTAAQGYTSWHCSSSQRPNRSTLLQCSLYTLIEAYRAMSVNYQLRPVTPRVTPGGMRAFFMMSHE